MPKVASSNIEAVDHDGGSTLRVRFKNGGVYEYQGVSEEAYQALLTAESVGKHFAAHVRNAFPSRKLSPEELAREAGMEPQPDLPIDGDDTNTETLP